MNDLDASYWKNCDSAMDAGLEEVVKHLRAINRDLLAMFAGVFLRSLRASRLAFLFIVYRH